MCKPCNNDNEFKRPLLFDLIGTPLSSIKLTPMLAKQAVAFLEEVNLKKPELLTTEFRERIQALGLRLRSKRSSPPPS